MKKVVVLLVSMMVVGNVFSASDFHNPCETNGDSIVLLLDKLKYIEEKKDDGGKVSDMVCKKIVPQWIALGCGMGGSLCALLAKCNNQENESIIGNFFSYGIGAYIVTRLVGYFAAGRIKKTVENEILRQYAPGLEALKKKNNIEDVHYLEKAYNVS